MRQNMLQACNVIPAGAPVTSIAFSDPQNGTVVTPRGTYTTSDGGVTWTGPGATPASGGG